MPAAFCLIKEHVDAFKKALKDGEIDPAKLVGMTSEERAIFFEKYVGKENAKQVNGLFESKLILKNQKAGYISWAKKVGGISRIAKKDLISRIEKLDIVLNPEEEKTFLHDLAAQKLGTEVSATEAKHIFDLSQRIQDLKKSQDPKTLTFPDTKTRLEYGAAKITLLNYVSDLKNEAKKLPFLERLKPVNYIKNASDLAGVAKALKASFDDSAIFRQGWKTLWTNPRIWTKNALLSFSDLVKTFKDKDKVLNGIIADIISRPNYERMHVAKLALGNHEEAYPTSIPSKVPFFGRIYRASETAYEGFIFRQRADIFDSYIKIAEKSGLDINDPVQLKGIGKIINSLTGRGDLGKLEPVAGVVNNVFFSPRFLKSNIDLLTVHAFDKEITPFARKQAAVNLVKVIMSTAAVLTIAKGVNPDSVETDPRSSDFGKIKIGDTRFDVSGGMASIITLTMRLITGMSKSSTTGTLTDLTSGKFGEPTRVDVLVNFFENKLSPAGSIIKDLMLGKDFNGKPLTVGGELNSLLTPLPIVNYFELKKDPNSAPVLATMIADALGIGANTYGQSQTDWSQSTGKEMIAFKNKVGDAKLQEANNKFNERYDAWNKKTFSNPKYKDLTEEAKSALIQRAKTTIKYTIFREYNFRYRPNTGAAARQDARSIKQLAPKK